LLTTLYAYDTLTTGIEFANGSSSTVFNNYWPYNAGVDICWGEYYWGQLTLAPEGSRTAAFVDLGSPAQLAAEYNIKYVIPINSIYGTIHYESGPQFLIGQTFYSTFVQLNSQVVNSLMNTVDNPSFNATLSHIYLIHIVDTDGFDRYVKMMVIDVNYPISVTIRWDVMYDATEQYDTCVEAVNSNTPIPPMPSPSVASAASFPGWVLACIVVLFVLVVILMGIIIFLLVNNRKKSSMENVPLVPYYAPPQQTVNYMPQQVYRQ